MRQWGVPIVERGKFLCFSFSSNVANGFFPKTVTWKIHILRRSLEKHHFSFPSSPAVFCLLNYIKSLPFAIFFAGQTNSTFLAAQKWHSFNESHAARALSEEVGAVDFYLLRLMMLQFSNFQGKSCKQNTMISAGCGGILFS